MLHYIYYAVAVIVLAGIAIIAVALLRRRGRGDDGLEGMTYADVVDGAGPGYGAGPANGAGPAYGAGLVGGEGTPAAAGLQGVEQLLADWRAQHEWSGANGETTSQPAPLASGAAAGAAGAEPAAFVVQPVALASAVTLPQPTAPAAQPSPLFAPNGNGSAAAVLADPLGVVILDLADGKGRVSGQELKRLDVFRPDRIQVATDTVQLPPRLENDGEVLMRLAQIKLYAATLELRSKWASQIVAGADVSIPDIPFSARDFKLKIARDIMALPAGDRSEVIGFLLGGLLNTKGSGTQLKQAVIDTLEHLHSAALVNVLLDCLDDPDPIVQDYALAAADRLLDGS